MTERESSQNKLLRRNVSADKPHRPDIATRFRPGQSGNRKGRPKGAKGRKQIVRGVALETHALAEEGSRRKRTTLELVLLSLRNRSLAGNVRAFRAIHDLLQRYAPQREAKKGGFLIVPAPMTLEEWTRAVAEHQRKGRGEPDADGGSSSL